MRSNLLTRKLRPSEVKPWVMQMMDSRGLTGTQAPSLATELVLFTTSLYFLRTKANSPPRTQVGSTRAEIQRVPHNPQCQGHSLWHFCLLTQPSPALTLFPGPLPRPEPCIPASVNFSVFAETPYPVTCSARNAFTPFAALSQLLGPSGRAQSSPHSPVPWPPCLLPR